ncbi:MAG: ABC transporter permease [Bacteroidetes bacterium]|nr:ABC transporter permease [Bacteroidota bacterium]
MNLALKIARRYLFAKKSTNAINIITGISVFGIAVGTAALILALSVFNGFEDLITSLYSNFNPDVKVTPVKGKTFVPDSTKLLQILDLDGVKYVSQSLQEVAFFEYKNNQDFGILKGVDPFYNKVTSIDSTVREGDYILRQEDRNMAVLGVGMRNKLGVSIEDFLTSVGVYMPRRKKVGPLQQPFKKRFVYPAGTFVIQQDFDNQYVLTSLEFVRNLLDLKGHVSALEIKLNEEISKQRTIEAIQAILGEGFAVKDRYRQEEAFLKLMKMEKWLSFVIVGLMLVLIAFNVIGALWMIVLEKKKDIAILKSMGAMDRTIRNIFLNEGLLLSFLGIISGFVLAIILYILQITVGIITIPGDFVIEVYPISMRLFDFIIVTLTVATIGLLASILPAQHAKRIPAMIREE